MHPQSHQVPPELADALRRAWANCRPRPKRGAYERLDALLVAAAVAGWQYAALGRPIGIDGTAIRQRVARADMPAELPAVSTPPFVRFDLRPALVLDDASTTALREMQKVAYTVNGGMPPGHPARLIGEEYARILAGHIAQGFTVHQLAKAIGVNYSAIRARLFRHGYAKPYPSLAGTPRGTYQNVQVGKSRPAPSECRRGHDLTGDNLGILKSGGRWCRACNRIAVRAYKDRKRAAEGGSPIKHRSPVPR